MTTQYKSFELEKKGAIAELYLNRPEKRNAMGLDFWEELSSIMVELDQDEEVRVVIILGRGKMFSGGLDLSSIPNIPSFNLSEQTPEGRLALVRYVEKWQDSLSSIERCRKPVIAAVHGGCIGGGLDLIAACDIRLASSDAYFSLREAAMAMIADLGSLQRLPLIIGQGLTRELAFTARNVSADEALQMHLVNHVYPDRETLITEARQMAERIAQVSPLAVQSTKEVLNYSRDKTVEAGLHYALVRNSMILPSGDLLEAFQAFMEKRQPKF